MNKKRLIISSVISIFLVATLLLGSTYSIFTSQEIDENTNVYTTGNLNVTYTLDTTNNIIFTDITPYAEDEADRVNPYRITVTNEGNVPYMFDVILSDTTSSVVNTIDYQYVMIKVGYFESKSLSDCNISDKNIVIKEDVILPAGSSVDIDVRVWLSDSIQNDEIGKSFYSKLMIDGLAIYNDNKDVDNSLLSLRYMNTTIDGVSSPLHFRESTYINKIKNASFVDYIDTSNASINAEINEKIIWDMSTAQDDSIIAWLEPNENEGYYNLYIGSTEKIYAKKLTSFFSDMSGLENIFFYNLDTSLTQYMNSMFYGCSNLTSLDLSNFETSNVTNMSSMFAYCSSLPSLNLSNFDTSDVTNMSSMFAYCSSLLSLNLSNFDTSNVTDMSSMFSGCRKLINFDISSFETGNVTTMTSMFYWCESIVSLDLSHFDTSKVVNMGSMFGDCVKLTSLDLSSFDTSNVTITAYMFGFSGITTLDLSNFDTSNVTNMSQMFRGCNKLLELDLSNFDTSKATNMQNMFYGCVKLSTTITIMNNSTTYTNMFTNAATEEETSIKVNYISDNTATNVNESTESLVESMVATKSTNSNVEKGICANCA